MQMRKNFLEASYYGIVKLHNLDPELVKGWGRAIMAIMKKFIHDDEQQFTSLEIKNAIPAMWEKLSAGMENVGMYAQSYLQDIEKKIQAHNN
jgi:hypothetical protein